jgi:hypothetical protein
MQARKVAVITVHGVADQKAGETGKSVVALLVASSPKGVVYTASGSDTFTLSVSPLGFDPDTPPRTDATPKGEDRPAMKAFVQSARSDYQRRGWKAPDSMDGAMASLRAAPKDAPPDRGIAVTGYLLRKHIDNGGKREPYETTRTRLQRSDGAAAATVDVFEMYWADLSRLATAMPRIVAELFTLIFRLSKLGRDTVDEARMALRGGPQGKAQGFCWWLAASLQIVLDWLFVNGLALLVLQLALLATMLLGLGLVSQSMAKLPDVHTYVAWAVAGAGALWLAYRASAIDWSLALGPLALLGIGVLALFWSTLQPWVTLLVLLGAVTLLGNSGLRVADDRFPFVRYMGLGLWSALLLLMVGHALHDMCAHAAVNATNANHATDVVQMGKRAALFGTDATLLAIKWMWIVIGGLLVGWLVVGWIAAATRGHESRASIATGRLGLTASLGAFLIMMMAVWALLSFTLGGITSDVDYEPVFFDAPKPPVAQPASQAASAASAVAACPPAPCPAASAPQSTGTAFLQHRYERSTLTFSVLATVYTFLLLFLIGMYVPSVLAELKLLAGRTRDAFQKNLQRRTPEDAAPGAWAEKAEERAAGSQHLGRWLTHGYRSLDGVVHLVTAAAVVLGLLVVLSFLDVMAFRYEAAAIEISQWLLKPLVISAAGVTATLIVLGGLLSKYLPAVRGPLDIALDVDNHFREFPRSNIPRARIFARYAALLRHVQAAGYDHIVIVSHSQGTVISAELLRYLSSRDGRPPGDGDAPRLDGAALAPVRLFTLGCPLRQLYAARFPTLYRWVITRHGAVSGPRAADIGVERWLNAFSSGDYVGRWLWSDHDPDDGASKDDTTRDVVGHPMADTVDARAFGRADAYAPFHPVPPNEAKLARAVELEVCLGLGAHTHYFEPEQTRVAWLIDFLIRADAPPAGAAPGLPIAAGPSGFDTPPVAT